MTDIPKPILPSVGIDIVEVDRIRKHLDDEAFLSRVFTERERADCLGRARAEESLAARWATKEAVAKALGTGIGQHLSFRDVEVISVDGHAPRVRLHGPMSQFPMSIVLSLAHTRTTGAAMVMIYPLEDPKSGVPPAE